MTIPPVQVEIISRPLRIPPGEQWCSACGADVPISLFAETTAQGICPVCGRHALVPAVQCLRDDEYFIAH